MKLHFLAGGPNIQPHILPKSYVFGHMAYVSIDTTFFIWLLHHVLKRMAFKKRHKRMVFYHTFLPPILLYALRIKWHLF